MSVRRWLVLATVLAGLGGIVLREERREVRRGGDVKKHCSVAVLNEDVIEVDFSGCSAVDMTGVAKLRRLVKVDLGSAQLTSVPEELLQHDTVEILLLANNPQLQDVPDFSKMSRLTFLGLRNCGLTGSLSPTHLPPSLTALVLTDNKLTSIGDLVTLSSLRKLMLSHNELSEIGRLPGGLELIRAAANPQLSLPSEHSIFSLQKLSWLALSGTKNELSLEDAGEVVLDTVRREGVKIERALGEGASGKVLSGVWEGKRVAVKNFKQTSSDGKATNEVEILKRIAHDDIVTAYGILENPLGAIFELLPGAKPLGTPPSFTTLVRNRPPPYPITQSLTIPTIIHVFSALRYIHSHSLAHGDIYAHNILTSQTSSPKLSDFGAAWFYPARISRAVQAAEVRGFSNLVEDLLEWCTDCTGDINRHAALVVARCRSAVSKRPTFDELTPIVAEFEGMF